MNQDFRGKKSLDYPNSKDVAKKIWNEKRLCKFKGWTFNPARFQNNGDYVEFGIFYDIYYHYEKNLRIPERLYNAALSYPKELHAFLKVYYPDCGQSCLLLSCS